MADFSLPQTKADTSKKPSVTEVQESDEPHRDISGDIIEDGLRRGLKGRQFVIIALGSIIGPGCFYGLGYGIYEAGPLGLLIGFSVVGASMWILMQSVGEVATLFPVHGGFVEHCDRFVDPALSFAVSWLYYFMWSVFLASDWNNATVFLQFWIPDTTIPVWAWYILFFVFFSILTTLGVNFYGETEYYFGMFKFLSLIVLFFISILADTGAFGNGYVGFRYWKEPYGPIRNGINGFGQVFVLAAAYYVGTEIVSVAAGESKNPQRDVPRATNSILYRILVVFVGMSFFQGLICPSTSDDLVHPSSTTASSPFTIGFVLAGWKSSGHFVNAIIIIAFISAANGVIYIQSRTLYSLALKRKAPSCFAITNTRGVPYPAIIFSNMWGFLGLMSLQTTAGSLFSYFTSFGGTAAYIAWASITFVHLRVRGAAKRKGIDAKEFPYTAPGHISIYWGNFFFNIFLLLIQGFTVFETPFNYSLFIASYISIPVFFLMFFGYKWWFKTKWLNWVIEDPDKAKKRSWGRRLVRILKE
ncbi:Amino acid/polyamine transporter I [Penicillium roqueforti FM164]|uniref:Amino acid/polyamine transporter I n=1 Tax=Penicillium roqueforti (strain FM164) TaxID=1365484 RepID=W6Q2I3_PENRF|nr:Amino acid/polyamine transporter I [Penicillium roqueforti FM164]